MLVMPHGSAESTTAVMRTLVLSDTMQSWYTTTELSMSAAQRVLRCISKAMHFNGCFDLYYETYRH
jgi:hypothetical protein